MNPVSLSVSVSRSVFSRDFKRFVGGEGRMKRGKRIQILIEDYEDYYTTFSEDLSPSIFSDPKYCRNRDRLIYIGVDCCCPIHSSHPRIVTAAFVGGSANLCTYIQWHFTLRDFRDQYNFFHKLKFTYSQYRGIYKKLYMNLNGYPLKTDFSSCWVP